METRQTSLRPRRSKRNNYSVYSDDNEEFDGVSSSTVSEEDEDSKKYLEDKDEVE